nr:MSCRAMM family adhesin SdrC [Fimbriiglobus ruber]
MSLGDTVWDDANNDGTLDNGETGLPGVVVTLLDASGNPVATTTTDAGGHYLFTDLIPGTYQVQIDPPAGYVSSSGTNGSLTGPFEPGSTDDTDAGNNTDHGTTTGATITSTPVTLTAPGTNPDAGSGGAGTANLNVDLGLYQPLSLGNFVFNDANNDGKMDNGETGVPGVAVVLLDASGAPVATTTTDAAGHYQFDDLAPGTYRVQITPRPGSSPAAGPTAAPPGRSSRARPTTPTPATTPTTGPPPGRPSPAPRSP